MNQTTRKNNSFINYIPVKFIRNTLKKRRNTKEQKELAKEAKELAKFNKIENEVTQIIEKINELISKIDKNIIYMVSVNDTLHNSVEVNDLQAVKLVNSQYNDIGNNANNANKNNANKEFFKEIASLFTQLKNINVQDINQKQFAEIHKKIMNVNGKGINDKYYSKNGNSYRKIDKYIRNDSDKTFILYDFINGELEECINAWDIKANKKYGETYTKVLNILHNTIFSDSHKKPTNDKTSNDYNNRMYKIHKELIELSKASMTDFVFNHLFGIIKEFLKKERKKIDEHKSKLSIGHFRPIYVAWKKRKMIRENKWHNVRGKIKINKMNTSYYEQHQQTEPEFYDIFFKD